VQDASDREAVAISLEGIAGAGNGVQSDELEVEDVTALASVRDPEGSVKSKTLVIRLERALRAGPSNVTGHWVVIGVVPGA
jgi:hypothetical protein